MTMELAGSLELDTRFQVASNQVVDEEIDNEVIIINLTNGKYFSLQAVATAIWCYLKQAYSLAEIVREIVLESGVDRVLAERDIKEFVTELVTEQLVMPLSIEAAGSAASQGQVNIVQTASIQHYSTPELQQYTDMQELLLLDPIHEVAETGWPATRPELSTESEFESSPTSLGTSSKA